jgi:hypothetical protein
VPRQFVPYDLARHHTYEEVNKNSLPYKRLPAPTKWWSAATVVPAPQNLIPSGGDPPMAPHDDALQWQPPVTSQTNGVFDDPIWTRSAADGGAVLVSKFIGPRQRVVYRYANPVTGELFDLYYPIDRNAI